MTHTLPLWIIAIQWISRLILALLFLLSVWSVATIIRSARLLKESGLSEDSFEDQMKTIGSWIDKKDLEQLRKWSANTRTIYGGTMQAILEVANLGAFQIDRSVKSYLSMKRSQIEGGLTILATLGSNAPFVGLFGTVLGIIQAFGILGTHQNNTTDIMVGISEALIATAIGLFVAIPAVVSFNVLSRRLKVLMVNAEALRDLFLSKTPQEVQNGR